jgi:hypothetical protein
MLQFPKCNTRADKLMKKQQLCKKGIVEHGFEHPLQTKPKVPQPKPMG